MKDFLLDFVVPFFFVSIAVMALITIMAIPVVWLDSKSCDRKAMSFDDHDYHIFGGCMVEHEGQWLPLDNIRGFD